MKKTVIHYRPIPDSRMCDFGKIIATHTWKIVFNEKLIDDKVVVFHSFLRTHLDTFFPEQIIKVSLDKKWFTPDLKTIHRQRQREFFQNHQSHKWRMLNIKFNKLKRKSVTNFYSF